MERTVQQRELDVEQRITGQGTFCHADVEGFFDGTPVLARYVAAGHLRFELVTGVFLGRLDTIIDLGELTGAAGLLLVRVGVFDRHRDRLAVSHLRFAHVHFDVVRALQDVHLDVQVQLAHTLDQGFARVLVGRYLERRVLLDHLVQRDTHLLHAGLVARCNRHRDHRVREHHRLERGRVVHVGEGVARARVFHAEQGDDVTGLR